MSPIYTFTCPHGHTFDGIVPYDTATLTCMECDALAVRTAIERPAKRNPEHGIQK